MEEFATHGRSGMTIEKVAARAGVARSTAAAPSMAKATARGEPNSLQGGRAVSYQRLAQNTFERSSASSTVWPSAHSVRPFESSEPTSSHQLRSKRMKLRKALASGFQACWMNEA